MEYTRPFSFWLLRQEKFSSYERIPAHYNKKHNTHSCGYCGVSAIYVPVPLVIAAHAQETKMAATRRVAAINFIQSYMINSSRA